MMLLPDECIRIGSSITDLFPGLETHLLVGYLVTYYTSASALLWPGNNKGILLVVGFSHNLFFLQLPYCVNM